MKKIKDKKEHEISLFPTNAYVQLVQVRKQIKDLVPGQQITLHFEQQRFQPDKYQVYSAWGEPAFMATIPGAEISEYFTPVDQL